METIEEKLKILEQYTEIDNMALCNLVHLYPTGINCVLDNSGFNDSQHFILWGFDIENKTKCNLGRHDGIMMSENTKVHIVRIFVDGSTIIRFTEKTKINLFQEVYFGEL